MEELCASCGCRADCAWHHVWECEAINAQRAGTFDRATVAAALAAGPSDVRYARGLFAILAIVGTQLS